MGYRSVFRPGLFEGQTVIVTGGGSGIGRCTAHELAALGAKVLLVGRTGARLEAVAAEIREDGGAADWRELDVRVEEKVRAVVADLRAAHGPIHGLVNNAGGQFPSPLQAISQKGFETVVRLNLVGGFLMAREVVGQSMQEHGGAIVNVTADFRNGMPAMGHSGAARAGMANLTQTAAVEWAPYGVRVNAVAPGWVASAGLDTYEGAFREIIPKLRAAVPLKRLGTEAEVSAAICFLLSEAAGFITGITLPIDGAAPLGNAVWPLEEHRRSKPYQGFHRAQTPKVLEEET